ncbi:hypothetical protein C8R43DRAFT_956604 [Mycena crocata]|nr:hypothetical protein C8R43DRAFT_956604 [Mycena crocata]
MYRLLPHFALLAFAAPFVSASIAGRDFDAAQIDGKHVPTTTNFYAPQTTDENSKIGFAYSLTSRSAERASSEKTLSAISQYHEKFGKDSDDPKDPSFISWAYSNVAFY